MSAPAADGALALDGQDPAPPTSSPTTASPTTGAADPAAAAPDSVRLAFLDGIRAVAAVYVVLHHTWLIYPGFPESVAPSWTSWLAYGHFAVAVFIVLSGFSLALVPSRHGFQPSTGYVPFMLRRARRILPPYWVALAFSVLIMGTLVGRVYPGVIDLKGVLTHAFLVQDIVEGRSPNGAFWSIAIEWQLYFFFPLFLLARRRLGAPATVAAAVVGVWLIGFGAENVGGPFAKILHVSPQMAALFVMGIVAAGARQRPARAADRRGPSGGWWGIVALVLGIGTVVAVAVMGTPRVIDNLYWLDLPAGGAAAAGLIALSRGQGAPLRRLLASRPFVWVGHFSYSLYLIHSPLLLVAWIYGVDDLPISMDAKILVMVLVVVPAIVVISWGFSICFERPFLRKRARTAVPTAA